MNIIEDNGTSIVIEEDFNEDVIKHDIYERIGYSLYLSDDTKEDIDRLLDNEHPIGNLILNVLANIESFAPAYNAAKPYSEVINVTLKTFDDKYDFISEVQTLGIEYGTEFYPDGDEYAMIICDLDSQYNGPLRWIETFVTSRYYEGSRTEIYQNFMYTDDEDEF